MLVLFYASKNRSAYIHLYKKEINNLICFVTGKSRLKSLASCLETQSLTEQRQGSQVVDLQKHVLSNLKAPNPVLGCKIQRNKIRSFPNRTCHVHCWRMKSFQTFHHTIIEIRMNCAHPKASGDRNSVCQTLMKYQG